MDELTAKKIESAKKILKGGHCSATNCEYCFGDQLYSERCGAERYDGHIPGRFFGGIDEHGRKFFEDKLKQCGEYEQEEKTEITCHHCSRSFKKSEYGIQHVKTIEGRTIEYWFCPACKNHMVALVE